MKPDLVYTNKKERTSQPVDFVFRADQKVTMNKSEKTQKFMDLGRDLKKLFSTPCEIFGPFLK